MAGADGGAGGVADCQRSASWWTASLHFAGKNSASTVDIAAIMLGAGVRLSLIMQIGEQIDYLRFMPPKTAENRKSWWLAVFFRRPGLGGVRRDQTDHLRAFLGFYLLTCFRRASIPNRCSSVSVFDNLVRRLAGPDAGGGALVVISQIKINVTNAYSGSLA